MRGKSPVRQIPFQIQVVSLDATTIKLCLSLFPWALFRQTKGGIKMHTLLDHDSHIPAFVTVTDDKTHESRIAQAMTLPKGSIFVFDKGFINYSWLRTLGERIISAARSSVGRTNTSGASRRAHTIGKYPS